MVGSINGDGQRIRQTEDGVTTKYYYDGASLLRTSVINYNSETENILDPAGKIAASKRFDGNYANMYFFYNYDIRGSVTSIIKPDGSLVKGYDYDEFGNTKESGESQFKNDIKFTGAVYDNSPGLYYMNARFYNPTTGRFLSQDTYNGDPYDPWTQNLYSYTSNNPVNYIDPTGHLMVSVTDDVAGTSVDDTSVVDVPIVDFYRSSKYFVPSNNTNNAVIRGMTTEEKIKSGVSEVLPFIPVINIANNAKIAVSGSDMTGRIYFNDEIQDARVYFAVDLLSFGLTGASVEGAAKAETKTLNEWLQDAPDLLDETKQWYNTKPEWWSIDPINTEVFYRTKDEVDAIRKLPGESGGHHPHGLALGGPEGQKLTITGETRTVKNPTHSQVTGLQRRVIREIRKNMGQ